MSLQVKIYVFFKLESAGRWRWTSGKNWNWTRWRVGEITRPRSSWRPNLIGKLEEISAPTITRKLLHFTGTRWPRTSQKSQILFLQLQISCEAKGESWSEETSSARNHKSSHLASSATSSRPSSKSSGEKGGGGMKESQTYHGFTDSAVSGGGYQVSCQFVNLVNSVSRNHKCRINWRWYFRGVPSQQGRFIRRGSSRRQRKTSLIGSRLRMQCAGTTCLPLKEENTPGSEVVATLVHLPALSPHRTLPQARWAVSPTPFQGICFSFPSCF